MDFPELDVPTPPALEVWNELLGVLAAEEISLGEAQPASHTCRGVLGAGTSLGGPQTICRHSSSPKTAPICTKGEPRQQHLLPQSSSLVLAGVDTKVTLLPRYSPASPNTGCLAVGGLCPPCSALPSPPITRGSPQTNTCHHQTNGVLQPASLGLVSPSVMQGVSAARCNHGK